VSTEVHADLEQKVFVVHSVAETVDTLDLARGRCGRRSIEVVATGHLDNSVPRNRFIDSQHVIPDALDVSLLRVAPNAKHPDNEHAALPGYVEGGSFTAAFIGVNQAFPVGSGLLKNFQCL
jgi:hypothetical protein